MSVDLNTAAAACTQVYDSSCLILIKQKLHSASGRRPKDHLISKFVAKFNTSICNTSIYTSVNMEVLSTWLCFPIILFWDELAL